MSFADSSGTRIYFEADGDGPPLLFLHEFAGGGYGSLPASRERFIAECRATAAAIEQAGRIPTEQMAKSPARIQLFNKAPEAWQTFVAGWAEPPAGAAARTLRRVQAGRPSLYDSEAALRAVEVPVLLMVGDEDEPCLDVNLFLKRIMPAAQLAILPGAGHVLNLEDPALFNATVERFLSAVDQGTWRPRDPVAMPGGGALGLAAAPEA